MDLKQCTMVLALTALAGIACDSGIGGSSIWPTEAPRGQLVAMPIASNNALPGFEQWDISKENLTVELSWPGGVNSPYTISKNEGLSVIEARAHPSNTTFPSLLIPDTIDPAGKWMGIAVFNVPDETVILTSELPATVTVTALKDGQPIPTGVSTNVIETTLRVVEGSAYILLPTAEELEPPPLMRMIGRAGVAPDIKFDVDWFLVENRKIGSMEFELEYPGTLTLDDVYPIADATHGTVIHAPGSQANRRKIILIDPNGFILVSPVFPPATSPYVGDGPFLDVAFTAGGFASNDFTVHDLKVADLDGDVLIDAPGDASSYFDFLIRGGE